MGSRHDPDDRDFFAEAPPVEEQESNDSGTRERVDRALEAITEDASDDEME